MQSRCLEDDVLQMFLDGVLEPVERTLVVEHLQRCPSCQATIGQYKQLMWDLDHPEPIDQPAEREQLHDTLMAEWMRASRAASENSRQDKARSLLPAWAGYSLMWTRVIPGIDKLGSFRDRSRWRRTSGTRLSLLKRWGKKGGGR